MFLGSFLSIFFFIAASLKKGKKCSTLLEYLTIEIHAMKKKWQNKKMPVDCFDCFINTSSGFFRIKRRQKLWKSLKLICIDFRKTFSFWGYEKGIDDLYYNSSPSRSCVEQIRITWNIFVMNFDKTINLARNI